MFQLSKTIVSEDILDHHFVCDLNACKGSCCVEGEAGAPLTKEEGELLIKLLPKLEPYLTEEGKNSIKEQGAYTVNPIGEYETPLIEGKACVYANTDEKGIVYCGIEKAHNDGVIDFYKPISCHLYPIRIKEYKSMTAVNYHSWPICHDACILGDKLKVPVYRFVKNALVRKFGQQWYDELDDMAQEYYSSKSKKS